MGLETGDNPGLQIGPNVIMKVLMREAGRSELEKEMWGWKHIYVCERDLKMLLAFDMKEGDMSPGMQWPLVAGRDKEQTVPGASRKNAVMPTPWFLNFWFPEPNHDVFVLFSSIEFVAICYSSNKSLTQVNEQVGHDKSTPVFLAPQVF